MMKITTATGKEYQAKWFGVSTIDNVFRANIVGLELNDAFPVFTNPEETQTITLYKDSMTQPEVLSGYTVFKSISDDIGSITIGLGKGV